MDPSILRQDYAACAHLSRVELAAVCHVCSSWWRNAKRPLILSSTWTKQQNFCFFLWRFSVESHASCRSHILNGCNMKIMWPGQKCKQITSVISGVKNRSFLQSPQRVNKDTGKYSGEALHFYPDVRAHSLWHIHHVIIFIYSQDRSHSPYSECGKDSGKLSSAWIGVSWDSEEKTHTLLLLLLLF